MNSLQISICILILSVFIASVSQILLKISANKTYSSRIREYLNVYVIFGYGLLFLSTLLTMIALKRVPLSWSPVVESEQLHFCICNGISGAEREIYEKENDGTAGDPYRDSGIFPLRDRYREEEKRCYYP